MVKVQKLLVLAAIGIGLAAFFSGCRVVEVENFGEEVVRDADDKPVTLPDGHIQTIKKGWSVYHNQHWMITQADTIEAKVKPEEIAFALNGLNTKPDAEGVKGLVQASLEGSANLAAKIGAAVATSGGSVGAEAVAAWVKKFVDAGGDAEKATVSVTDGSVTCTDGSCTVVGACADGSCEIK